MEAVIYTAQVSTGQFEPNRDGGEGAQLQRWARTVQAAAGWPTILFSRTRFDAQLKIRQDPGRAPPWLAQLDIMP